MPFLPLPGGAAKITRSSDRPDRRRPRGARGGTGWIRSAERLGRQTVVAEGEAAPDFTLLSDAGEGVMLSSFRGRPVVLYFYPKDDTPGCTAQAIDIRDAWSDFRDRGAVVLGVSPDSVKSHQEFKEKYGLPFTLLADPEHEVAEQYGVWVEKKNYGKTYMGVNRSTFVIAPDGTVAKALYGVKATEHADLVLGALAESAP
jgi:peroxiredoxin Q/BCP